MAARNFKLFLGCLGNGVTVCNSAVMEDGDFKMVAHISNEGEITWYVGEDYPPADALASIRACAEQERAKYETWLKACLRPRAVSISSSGCRSLSYSRNSARRKKKGRKHNDPRYSRLRQPQGGIR